MCVCFSSELQEKRADWRLDSRDAEVFPYKKSTDGEEADCFPVSIQAGEEDKRVSTEMDLDREGEGWFALSVRLFMVDDVDVVNVCSDERAR